MKKQAVLRVIVLFELVLGIAAILFYFHRQNKLLDQQLAEQVTVINRDQTEQKLDQDLKYYWEFKPNQEQTDEKSWLENKVSYHINSDGLHDRFDYPINKEPDAYRIITLGDSFTFGQYLNTKQNWTELLENKVNHVLSPRDQTCAINKIEVINLAMPGFDVEHLVKRYQEIGTKYNPDLIIWLESDQGFTRFSELMMPLIEVCEERAADNVSQQINRQQDFHRCWNQAADQIRKEYGVDFLRQRLMNSFENFFSAAEPERVVFFYFDNPTQEKELIVSLLEKKYPQASYLRSIPELTEAQRLVDGHPNLEGQQLIAEQIMNYLAKQRLQCLN